jgi:DNA-binding response OmpR family regulator
MTRILLVEDDRALCSMLALMLRRAGHVIVGEVVGSAAIEAIDARNYDLVISDAFMPEFDGVAVTRAVRRVKPDCPIIAISGGSDETSAYLGLTMMAVFGADALLYKPFSGAELLSAIEAAEDRHSIPKLRVIDSQVG